MHELECFEAQLNDEYPDIELQNRQMEMIENAPREFEGDITGTHVRDQICHLLSTRK